MRHTSRAVPTFGTANAKKMHASESGSDSQCRSDTDSVFIYSVLWSMAMHVS